MKTTKTDVLIVGAGPTGLALACQLIRHGVEFLILDRNETTTPHSKAIGVQARTLEIYEQIGLAEPLIARGALAEKARLVVGGEVRGEIEFAEIGKGLSPYPYVLIVEQGRHEKLLHDFITTNGREVRWRTRLEEFSHTEAGVRARVVGADGVEETIGAKFLVGCDGAKSPVRHALGLKFEGSTFERMFYVADVRIDWRFPHDALTVFLMRHNLLAFFPMTGDGQWRIVGTFPEEFAGEEGEVLYEEIEGQIKRDAEIDFDITRVNWFSTYKVHSRHVHRFSSGRCFLAGDSAHIHTPAGAQGMNTGIQDGYNLAWKLALVLKGRAGARILETYNEERLENAKNLLKTTDRFFNLVASPEPVLSYLRTHVFPYVAGAAFSVEAVKRFVFPRISQIGINYRHSSLSAEGGGDFGVKAGDRMPYFLIDGGSVYDRLREPKFHLLAFSDVPGDFQTVRAELESRHADSVDFHALPLDVRAKEVFDARQPFYVLLRPDNYVGLISSENSAGGLRDYLNRFAAGGSGI
ncbi:MAG TPA: FAD-dependent monooxygenase [Pyrinomonadaceae bacterium]|jgi:2-polyprenyl-6-methoxyphenol hydroxylase-like FAD-dependent oxidoreductase|nr:FAD-dependent monooxygenase [Pyrinomonadaceae bacterium]